LSRFVGMLTDSRGFMSYPRHEYFRRILCNLLGHEVAAGLLPDDKTLIESIVRRICHGNTDSFLDLITAETES
jgi:glucuronate isomerase